MLILQLNLLYFLGAVASMFWVDSELGSDIYLDGKQRKLVPVFSVMYSYNLRQDFRRCLKDIVLVLTSTDLTTKTHFLALILVYLMSCFSSLKPAKVVYVLQRDQITRDLDFDTRGNKSKRKHLIS